MSQNLKVETNYEQLQESELDKNYLLPNFKSTLENIMNVAKKHVSKDLGIYDRSNSSQVFTDK